MKRKLDFAGKWVIVTGAARGLGREMTRQLVLREGAKVIAIDIREDLLETLVREMNEYLPGSVISCPADLSKGDEISRAFASIEKDYPIFALINNAGMTHYGPTESSHLDRYEKIIEINFLAAVKMSLLAMDHFKANGKGYILNITSLGGFVPLAYQNIYSASKHALQSFSQALSEETRGSGIGVSIYAPGGIKTDMVLESGLAEHFKSVSFGMLDSKTVARKAIDSMKNRKDIGTSGFMDNGFILFSKFLPGKFTRKLMSAMYKPALTT